MTKRWSVQVPIAGVATVEVEAEDVDGAISVAMDRVRHADEYTDDVTAMWEPYDRIVSGSVLFAPLNEPTAEEIDE